MKPIKVNGVVVCCSNCINHQVSPLDEPCKDCWKAIFHSGNIDEVRLDDIVFYPADKERFLTLEKMVKKYKDQFAAMKADAKGEYACNDKIVSQMVVGRPKGHFQTQDWWNWQTRRIQVPLPSA